MEDEIVLGEDDEQVPLADEGDDMMEEAPEVFDIDDSEEPDFLEEDEMPGDSEEPEEAGPEELAEADEPEEGLD